MIWNADGTGGEAKLASHGVDKDAIQAYSPFHVQFTLLARRAARNMWRNNLILKVRLMTVVGTKFFEG